MFSDHFRNTQWSADPIRGIYEGVAPPLELTESMFNTKNHVILQESEPRSAVHTVVVWRSSMLKYQSAQHVETYGGIQLSG